MKPPCGKSCDKREVGCHAKCEKWQEYEAWRNGNYRKLYEQSVMDRPSGMFERNMRNALNRRYRYGRNDRSE